MGDDSFLVHYVKDFYPFLSEGVAYESSMASEIQELCAEYRAFLFLNEFKKLIEASSELWCFHIFLIVSAVAAELWYMDVTYLELFHILFFEVFEFR